MRIVIDMQGAQGLSRQRGIGRYSLALVRALLRQKKRQHQIFLVLNGCFPDSAEALRQEFTQYLPDDQVLTWFAPAPLSQIDPGNDSRRELGTRLYEAFIASLAPDCLLVTSLFEGLGDNALTCVKQTLSSYPVAVILYDLIPLIQRSPYLDNPAHARWYDNKIEHLKRADLLLSISESSRREGLEHLHRSEDSIVNISSAIDPLFKPIQISPEREHVLRTHYGLTKPFVMYTGGIDHRKNISGLLAAFARLPEHLRQTHQLALVCSVQEQERQRLLTEARQHGLQADQFILTGFVPEQDLLELYNLCTAFIFPSLHEGFGLPALEAMACGAPVIASNTTSLPEVVGLDEALFDPLDTAAISRQLERLLTDEPFRLRLKQHGLEQARRFNWDKTACRALQALEALLDNTSAPPPAADQRRPRLAYVSPLPPERSGISDYSAMLLPALSRYYDIELIIAQDSVDDGIRAEGWPIHGPERLIEQAQHYDRVLYQFGNSAFHSHMFNLLEQVPGVVVLHDFFLSGVIAHREYTTGPAHSWSQTLYASHGYPAVAERCHQADPAEVIWRYPCNLPVLQQALGVIVHSPNSQRLARAWYGPQAGADWHCIPLVRPLVERQTDTRQRAREALQIPPDARLVCSFGFLGSTKLNHRLLGAWLQSELAQDPDAYLVFVGDNDPGEYGHQLMRTITRSGAAERIRITGWTDSDTYRLYLQAADIGVQLRSRSRGETSAAVLDCMSHGLATLVNANGSMADLPPDCVRMLPDDFSDQQLITQLQQLVHNPEQCRELGARAAAYLRQHHAPEACARRYSDAIEHCYRQPPATLHTLLTELSRHPAVRLANEDSLCQLASAIEASFAEPIHQPQLLIDITGLTGQDTPRALPLRLLDHWLRQPPGGFRVEPVRMGEAGQPVYARRYALQQLDCPPELLAEDPVQIAAGDIWLGLELAPEHHQSQAELYRLLRLRGVHLGLSSRGELPGTVHHQLETLLHLFSTAPDADNAQLMVDISELARMDAGTGIQRVVRNILSHWQQTPPHGYAIVPIVADQVRRGYRRATRFILRQLGWSDGLLPDLPLSVQPGDCYLGLDLQPTVVTHQRETYRQWRAQGVHTAFVVYDLLALQHPEWFLPGAEALYRPWLDTVAEADQLIAISRTVASHLQKTLSDPPRIDWFHLGADLGPLPPNDSPALALPEGTTNFLMVGTLEPRKGHSQVLAAFERLWQNNLPVGLVIAGKPGWLTEALCRSLQQHPEQGRRLFWYPHPDDAQLQALYRNCHCLLAASWDEGFGLPLIEAAREGLPLLARDIAIFREVAGEHASYFTAEDDQDLARAIEHWLRDYQLGRIPDSTRLSWLSWADSARELAARLPHR